MSTGNMSTGNMSTGNMSTGSPSTGNMNRSPERAIGNLLRPPRRRHFILLLIGAILVAFVCWYTGMDLPHAVTVAAALTAAGLCFIAAPDPERAPWPDEETGTGAEGARRDIVQLSWSMRPRYGRIRTSGLGRVQNLARYRLALHQLDLRNPHDRAAIERLIGTAAYATLHSDKRLPLLRSVVHCLDMLDRLKQQNPQKEKPHD